MLLSTCTLFFFSAYAQSDEDINSGPQNTIGFLDTVFDIIQINTSQGASTTSTYINVVGINSDVQYFLADEFDRGPSFGIRFAALTNNNLTLQYEYYLAGLGGGYSFHKTFRISANVSYSYSYLFHQAELDRNTETNQITYSYIELPALHAVNIETYLLFQPSPVFAIQPYGMYIKGIEEGNPLRYKAGLNIYFKGTLLGYDYTSFPDTNIHAIRLGIRAIK